jgi:hypothetical protein
MKQKNFIVAALLLFGLSLFFDAAYAQAYGVRRGRRLPRRPAKMQRTQPMPAPSLGLYWGHNFDAEQNLVGAQLNLPVGRFWEFAPGVEYTLTNDAAKYDRWQFNGDLVFKPRPAGFLYFGGGLAVEYLIPEKMDNQVNFGGNALVGLEFGCAPMKLFVQGRWTFLEETSFAAMGGLRLSLR